jgi:hypothetical protein
MQKLKCLSGKTMETVVPANAANSTEFKDSILLEIRKKRQAYLDSISNQTVFDLGIAQYTLPGLQRPAIEPWSRFAGRHECRAAGVNRGSDQGTGRQQQRSYLP